MTWSSSFFVRFEAPNVISYLTRFYFTAPEWRVTEDPDKAHPFENKSAANAALEAFGPYGPDFDRVKVCIVEGGPDA